MIKRVLLLSVSLLLFFNLSVSPILAAPSVNLTTSADRKFAYLSFSGLRAVSKVDYTLTYDTQNRNTGLAGGFKTKKFTSKSNRRQILGTCSTRFCTYHKNPKNITLQVTFTLRSGGTSTITKTLP